MFSLSKKMQKMNFTSTHNFLVSALQQPWTAVYTKVIAIALLYGATVHVGNILGLTGTPWLATPLLWRGFAWSIWLLFGGILLLQILPYTLLQSHFILKPEDAQVLNSLIGTEILLLCILVLLLWLKK